MEEKDNLTATTIAATFILRYYTVMSTVPETIGNFYSDKSTYTRRTGTGAAPDASSTIVGGDKIQQEVIKLGLKGCIVSVKSIDCQMSLNEALFISCSGLISIQDEEEDRLFFQSFFLEKDGHSTYYILNDIFSFVDKRLVQTHTPDEANNQYVEEEDEEEVEEPTMNGNHGEQQESTPSPVVVEQPEPATPVVVVVEKEVAVEKKVEITPVTQVVVEKEVAAVVVEKEKEKETPKESTKSTTAGVAKAAPTYAEISMSKPSSATPQSSTPQPLASPTNTTPAPASVVVVANQAPAANNNNNNKNDRHHQNKGHHNNEKNKDHKEGCTIFITPVDQSIQFDQDQHKQQFRSLFTPFGNISNVRVLSAYAFVEFEKPETVQEVLNKRSKSPMILGDSIALKIEEKRFQAKNQFKHKKNQRSQDKQNENNNNNNNKNNENNLNNNNNTKPQPKRVQSPKPVKQQQQQQNNNNNDATPKPPNNKVNLNK